MKNKKTTMAILLGLLVGAGSTVYADQVVLGASQDATIFEPNVAQETWTEMRVRWQSDDTWGRNHPVVQFDLSSLPALGAGESFQINSARFGFWAWTHDDTGPGWPAADDFRSWQCIITRVHGALRAARHQHSIIQCPSTRMAWIRMVVALGLH